MGTSQFGQIDIIINSVVALEPTSILDIGCGFGKYGFLCREAMVCGRTINPKIDAIEAFEENITDVHYLIYNNVFISGALSKLKELSAKSYDLILAIDILEHFSKEDGRMFLSELNRIGRNVIISTPKMVLSQSALSGNVYEIHKTQWYPSDLKRDNCVFLRDRISHIIVIGEDIEKIKIANRHRNIIAIMQIGMKIKRWFAPFEVVV